RTIQLVNEPGRYGLEKLINSAQRNRRPDGTFDLTWTQGSVTVSVSMRIISTSQPTASSGNAPQQQGLSGVQLPSSVANVGPAAGNPNTPNVPGAPGTPNTAGNAQNNNAPVNAPAGAMTTANATGANNNAGEAQ
ncbi:MAG TPA: type VI secretion system membrane subunit TssM, partial [Paraburkholderia sp.]|nr:type VI secretion system membrane subunit TssM [Paraburkholderia sp.]